nr:MAG TPA: hypothetical protein [Caudoviricetes sp.]
MLFAVNTAILLASCCIVFPFFYYPTAPAN